MLSITQDRVFRQRSFTTTAWNGKPLSPFDEARRDLGVPTIFITLVDTIQGLVMNADQIKGEEDARKVVYSSRAIEHKAERPKGRHS